jgi:outer membrane protein assembly factor BamB
LSISKVNTTVRLTSLSLLVLLLVSARLSADWPQFRGPDGQGHSNAKGVPLHWDETKNVTWKTAIPGKGWSSPVISGNQIWVTTAHAEGKSLHAVCVDRTSGEILHDVEVLQTDDPGPRHAQNGFASPTPVLDGTHVFVHFGPHGTVCLDTDGKRVWENTEFDFALLHGSASSPILHGNLLILSCEGSDQQFLVALNKQTGTVKWREPRQHFKAPAKETSIAKMSYSTPLVSVVNGVAQLVSTSADHVAAYDVETGKEIWWMPYDGFSMVPRPSFGNGLFYIVGSVRVGQNAVYAIRPGKGQLRDEQLAWQHSIGASYIPSPLLVGKELFVVRDGGVATCLDAMTGEEHWKKRLGGNFCASPIEVRGRIYVYNQEGKALVLAAGKQFKILATNKLDGTFRASPAVAGRALFLRSDTHLYRIED